VNRTNQNDWNEKGSNVTNKLLEQKSEKNKIKKKHTERINKENNTKRLK